MLSKKSHLLLMSLLLIIPAHKTMSMNTSCQIIKSKEHSNDITIMRKMSGLYSSFRPKNFTKELYINVLSFLYAPPSIPQSLAYKLVQPSPPVEIEASENTIEKESPDGKIKVIITEPGRVIPGSITIEDNKTKTQSVVGYYTNTTTVNSIYFDCHSSMIAINTTFPDSNTGDPQPDGKIFDLKSAKIILSDFGRLQINKCWFTPDGKIMACIRQDISGKKETVLIDTPQDHFFKNATNPQLLLTHIIAQHYDKHGKASLTRIAQENECDVTLLQKTLHTFKDVPKLLLIETYNIENVVKNESRCKILQEMCTIQ